MPDDLAELRTRVQRLEDLEAIRATWLDYCHRLDLFDLGGLGDVFTDDADLEIDGLAATLDGMYHGRRSIIDDFYRGTITFSSSDSNDDCETLRAANPDNRPLNECDLRVVLGRFSFRVK